MSLLDVVKGKLASRESKTDKNDLDELEKRSPQAYRALQAMLKAYADSKLSYKLSGVNIVSDKHNKGLFDQPELNTVASVWPRSGVFTIVYVPEHRQFAAANRQVNELRHWINAHQYAGSFKFGRLYHNMTRPVLEVTYEMSYAYCDLKAGQITALASKALDRMMGYRLTMLPVVQLFADLRANINSRGVPVSSDPAGGAVFNHFDNASRVTLTGTTQKHQFLGKALVDFLDRREISTMLMPDRKRLRLNLTEPSLRSVDIHTYLTRHNHVVFEAHLPLTVKEAASRFFHSVYPAFINDIVSLGGSFQVDLEKNAVFYRYGVDVRGIEEITDDALFGSLLDEVKRIVPWLEGFRQVVSGADEMQVIQHLSGPALPGAGRYGETGYLEAAEHYYRYLETMFASVSTGPRLGLKLPDAASSMLPVTASTMEAAAETRPIMLPADSVFAPNPKITQNGYPPVATDPVERHHFAEEDSFWFEPLWNKTGDQETAAPSQTSRQGVTFTSPPGQKIEAQQGPMETFAVQPAWEPQAVVRSQAAVAQPVSVRFLPGRVVMLVLIGIVLATQIWMGFSLARLNSRVVHLQEAVTTYQGSMTTMHEMVLEALVRVEFLERGK